MPKKARGRAPRCGALPSSGCSAPPVPVPGWAMRRWPAPSAHCRQRGCLQPSAKSHSKSAPANQEHPHFTAFFPKKPTRPLLASIPPCRRTAPRGLSSPCRRVEPATSSRLRLAGVASRAAACRSRARFGTLHGRRRSRSLRILGCSLPSFLTVRNRRPGEKTILSANYHNYPVTAILDEFLMKCALVSPGFHNFQVQPSRSSHLLHKGFSSPPQTGAAGAGEEDGPSRKFACACQN